MADDDEPALDLSLKKKKKKKPAADELADDMAAVTVGDDDDDAGELDLTKMQLHTRRHQDFGRVPPLLRGGEVEAEGPALLKGADAFHIQG